MHDRYEVYPPIARRPASELAEERREHIAQERAAIQADKDRKFAQQRSIESSPERRISLWEARHGLALPRTASHPLIPFIAQSTDLDVEQVHAEQRRRALLRGKPVA